MTKNEKQFDLNIEKILENWEIHHAIREIIANALDEQILTNSENIKIYKTEPSTWHIRDYGRGLHYKHLTQKENEEKLNNEKLIGQFGIGLKDALATFNRNNIDVIIKSRYLIIEKIELVEKTGFSDIYTLHAILRETNETNFEGTEFILRNIDEENINKAKKLFLKFSNTKILTSNKYGQILSKESNTANIYLNGIKIAEEDNFLFSYNITASDKKIKKALNRERTNVGRAAYSDRIKLIIKTCTDSKILELFGNEFQNLGKGSSSEEINWIDIQEHVIKYLNSDNYIFVTQEESLSYRPMIDEAQMSKKQIIFIPENLKNKFNDMQDIHGNKINDLTNYMKERNKNFNYKFIDPKYLNQNELKIFDKTDEILNLIGGKPKNVKSIKISETMQNDSLSFLPAVGIWNPETGEIIIKRSQLNSLNYFSGTLIHEIIHAKSNYSDVSREFEKELTNVIGLITSKFL